MTRLLQASTLVAAILWAGVASADSAFFGRLLRTQQSIAVGPGFGPQMTPQPDVVLDPSLSGPSGYPAAGTLLPMPAASPMLPLCSNVKYRDVRNIAPCAVPMLVCVQDPCGCDDVCTCRTKMVAVEICVPVCECPPKVTTSRCGRKVRYDFGKYAVSVVSKRGCVVVNYDD